MIVVGYTMDTMYFSWQESPVEIDPGVQLPQFMLEGKILYDCSQNYTAGQCSPFQFSSVHRSSSFRCRIAALRRFLEAPDLLRMIEAIDVVLGNRLSLE